MMRWNTLRYLFKEGIMGLWKNKTMSLASAGTIILCLLILGMSYSVGLNIDYLLKQVENKFGINNDDIVLTHDAVRPFVSTRIINDNIDMAKVYGATDTVVKACDTIVKSTDSNIITSIPNRDYMYLGQTPQSFNLLKLKTLLSELTEEEKSTLTDCAKIFILKKENVKLVNGEYSNIKITNPFDFKVASMLLNKGALSDK